MKNFGGNNSLCPGCDRSIPIIAGATGMRRQVPRLALEEPHGQSVVLICQDCADRVGPVDLSVMLRDWLRR